MFDTGKFIKEVEHRPIIYNTQIEGYYNRELKQKCWFEIGNAMFDDWETLDSEEQFDTVVDLMKKWRFIRDAFVRNYKATVLKPKNNQHRRKYVFFDQLQFLLPVTKGLKNVQSSNDDNMDCSLSAPNMSAFSDNSNNDCDKIGAKRARMIFPQKVLSHTDSVPKIKSPGKSLLENTKDSHSQLISIRREEKRDPEISDEYGHSSFLASFLPMLCGMPINRAMHVRLHISEIFSEHFIQKGCKQPH
ncbi:uncharacterized protein LOC111050226 [Nilaparvata lugens]|uniref:uncharacterized protein LOC111050226 n=1 Tax=Nilaparvata lugens TaxID=108931 RepID=UPI00193D8528|nr:uncharacterized protein LOC111050226 [Nilaparvata lugens]